MTDQTTILYIEDNRDNQRLVQRILNAHSYQVLLAEDGPQGLALARENLPALILVDINIPGLNGYETTTRLRSLAHLKHVPIIAITADTRPGVRERMLVAGCNGFIEKPIAPRKLPDQIKEFLNGKHESVSQAEETLILREYSERLVERLEAQVRELSAANAELQESDRLKSNFLATLSHELRTPLTSILGYLELFERQTLGPLNDLQNQAISVVARNTRALAHILNNLLYLQEVRSSAIKRVPINLSELLKQTIRDLTARAREAQVEMDVSMPAEVKFVGDPYALSQAYYNLIENAIKFNLPGGKLHISLSEDDCRVIFRVEDTGIGIDEQNMEKIFLPFYQVDDSLTRPYNGAGLGLPIVRYIAEVFGGHVIARSQPGSGSSFTLYLPRTLETLARGT